MNSKPVNPSLLNTLIGDLDNLDMGDLLVLVVNAGANYEDVKFKGGKSGEETFKQIRNNNLADLLQLFKWLRVRGDNLLKASKNDPLLQGLIGVQKFNLWAKNNKSGNSTLMIKLLWAPIWGKLCKLIPAPHIGDQDETQITLLPQLQWPGYIAIIPITDKFIGQFQYHTAFTQWYIKIRARNSKTKQPEEDVVEERNRKQLGFQKALIKTLSETTKGTYFASVKDNATIDWEKPEFGSDALTGTMEDAMEKAIAKYSKWNKEQLFAYLTTHSMSGEAM